MSRCYRLGIDQLPAGECGKGHRRTRIPMGIWDSCEKCDFYEKCDFCEKWDFYEKWDSCEKLESYEK